jgi:Na+/H+-translocating membrane pyrophosphatase
LYEEYRYLSAFIGVFAIVIFVAVDIVGQTVPEGESTIVQFYTSIAFIIGASTSVLCGYIGM